MSTYFMTSFTFHSKQVIVYANKLMLAVSIGVPSHLAITGCLPQDPFQKQTGLEGDQELNSCSVN